MGKHSSPTNGRGPLVVAAAGALALSLLWGVAPGETIVSGNIQTNTTWTIGGSPYIVYGVNPPSNKNIEVRNNSTLTIDPGVEVRFQAGTKLVTVASSSIVAVGALGDSIVFTSNAVTPAPGNWHSVGVFSSPSSEFQYCKFEYAAYGLWLSGSDPDVTRVAFDDCQIGLYLIESSPRVNECSFRYSPLRNVWSNSTPAGVSKPEFWHCNLLTAGATNIRLDGYTTPETIEARFNWWGTTSATAIAATIYDSVDGPGLGTVAFDPWLEQVPVERSSWGRIKALFR